MSADNWEPTVYVRSVAFVVREIGLSTVVVLFLLGQQAGWIPSPGMEGHHAIEQAVQSNSAVLIYNRGVLDDIEDSTSQTVDAIKATCYNNATSDTERSICRYGLRALGIDSSKALPHP